MRWFALDLNPEPWAVGPVGYSRRGGKMSAYVGRNQQLDAYKEAVREALAALFVDHPEMDSSMVEGKVRLEFYFWRNRAEYTTPQARTHRKHEADVTNLQKATEDALQGVLFSNDRDVADIHSYMVAQGPDVSPCILIGVEEAGEVVIPEEAAYLLDKGQEELPLDDDSARWRPPAEDTF